MAITASDIQAFPSGEFSGDSTSVIDDAIAEAALFLDTDFWPADQFDVAHKYLTAHILTILKKGSGAAAGQVTGVNAGDLSISYATGDNGSSDSWLSLTPYGQRYANMLRLLRYKSTPRTIWGTTE